jgi:O-antigen ligase
VGFETAIMGTTFNSGRLLLIGGGALTTERITSAVVGNRVWAHNDFLEMLATGGAFLLLGYLALLMWLYWSFWLLARDPRQGRAARDVGIVGLLAVGAFTVVSMFNGVVTSPAVAFAVLLGLARGMTTTPGATFLDRPERSRTRTFDKAWTGGEGR